MADMAGHPPTDAAGIGRALSETFADLGEVAVTRILGSGFNSIAVETDAGAVFRIAKTEGTAERFAKEQRILPLLQSRLPVAVPEPRWFTERSARFPFGVMGYPMLVGQSLLPELLRPDTAPILAAQVADVLLALHRPPAATVAALALPGPAERPAHFRTLRNETLPALSERLRQTEFQRIERWWDSFLSDDRLTQFEPAVSHGDFWFANMLVDGAGSRLVAIVDWEHAAVGDPALDFSTLLHLGEDFTAGVIAAYRQAGGVFGEDDAYRMRRLWELRHFYGVLFSVRFNDEREMEDSIRKLRAGPIFDAL